MCFMFICVEKVVRDTLVTFDNAKISCFVLYQDLEQSGIQTTNLCVLLTSISLTMALLTNIRPIIEKFNIVIRPLIST